MTTRIWQEMAKVGVVALTMGLMTGTAQANNPATWNFAQGGTVLTGVIATSTGFLVSEGQTNALASGVPTATATGWSNTGGTISGGVSTYSNSLLQQGYIGAYGHMGVTDALANSPSPPLLGAGQTPTNADATGGALNTTTNELNSPNHAIDNSVNIDSVLFTFSGSNKVNLTSFTIGWENIDADYTVLAYTGLGTPTLSGLTYGNTPSCSGAACKGLEQNGWTLIGNYNCGGCSVNTPLSFNNNTSSSYWLIGAYNPLVPLNGFTNPSGIDAGNDYFKIFSLTGSVCTTNCGGGSAGVPEPGTLLLMGAGLIGLVRTTRRRQVLAA